MNQTKQLISINENPFVLFDKWFLEAKEKEINDPNAMNLATVGRDLYPSSRMVLLKSYHSSGFVFYTNLNSRKGTMISENANVVLNFHWKSLSRQVRIEGAAKQVSNAKADEYFKTRPLDSRIGAWTSNQSSELESREKLISIFKDYKKKFLDNNIPRPNYWSGFNVAPELIEFWQEMPFRLHDRVEFTNIDNKWVGKRLFP